MDDNSSFAYNVTHGVAIEEMLHMTDAANLLNAIGGAPDKASPLCARARLLMQAGGPAAGSCRRASCCRQSRPVPDCALQGVRPSAKAGCGR